MSIGLVGCHQETPPLLSTAETNTVGTNEVPIDEAEAEADEVEPGARTLWFADGPGHDAILARERRDHASAVASLDELLADPELSNSDRGAAELLRAFEDLRVDRWPEAAQRLARARATEALAPIEPYLRMLEAQARLDASESEAALELIDELGSDFAAGRAAGVPARVLLIKADAQARTQDRAGAIASYEAFTTHAKGSELHEARRKLAVLLLAGDDDDKRAAAKLFERLVVEVPLSDYGEEAAAELDKLEKAKLITRTKAERKRLDRLAAKAEIDRHLDRRSYGAAITAADAFIKRAKQLGADEGDRCEVLYAKGSAIFKQRKRPAAQPVFDLAAKHCKAAGDKTLTVKTRYQAARGLYAGGKHAQAAKRFETLANDHADHSYADDCYIKAGESWESAGEPGKARAAYERALAKHPNGDMYGEALRRLLVQGFAEGRIQDALDLIDRSIAGGKIHGDELAKLHYFRGKALDHLGDADEAEAAYTRAIETRPLSYPALQALSRLRERDEDAAARGFALISTGTNEAVPELELPATDTARRVKIWASLGLGDQASEELDAAGIDGWPAVATLAQAGLYSEAQRTLAGLGSSWRRGGPAGDRRALWELAHPVPFRGLVDPGEQGHGVPRMLTYAIMQSESRFNPGATSWAGARGLIQLMPATADNVAQRAGLKLDPSQLYDPAVNLDIGQRYLAGLTARWGNVDGAPALAVPSYNAGPGRTDEWLQQRGSWDLDLFVEAIPFDETRRYTQSVLGRWAAYSWLYGDGDDADRMPYIPLRIPARAG
ncbi:Soluble lytic murein transglycosylase precursor [Enhygromyxa salina]|uniref:Soluble lytic murein transglycosylase n=1 Tax=Enhygromyxa salina TaxID=215803 RepID=A0A2S9YG94_9BACT|nr:transglycosylase SLT domain-containing protein [Enhygromyxa salina]PRQ04119.1 Soluble lytic murein transglycosylase precursor [Enhygromyxa salina]